MEMVVAHQRSIFKSQKPVEVLDVGLKLFIFIQNIVFYCTLRPSPFKEFCETRKCDKYFPKNIQGFVR
jgi:hypothetical protein